MMIVIVIRERGGDQGTDNRQTDDRQSMNMKMNMTEYEYEYEYDRQTDDEYNDDSDDEQGEFYYFIFSIKSLIDVIS